MALFRNDMRFYLNPSISSAGGSIVIISIQFFTYLKCEHLKLLKNKKHTWNTLFSLFFSFFVLLEGYNLRSILISRNSVFSIDFKLSSRVGQNIYEKKVKTSEKKNC